MSKNILITGGTGLVGKRLIELLVQDGHQVSILSRSKNSASKYPVFTWDYASGHLEDGAFDGIDTIIHLAGAGVADEKWSAERKTVLLESRTQTSNLLYQKLKEANHSVKTIIAASAIGIYGSENSPTMMVENSPVGHDFLAHVTDAWEASTRRFRELNVRLVQMRIGIVLSEQGGALMELLKPPVAAPLGKGNQYMSWIHMDDVCGMIQHVLDNEDTNGPYNVVGPRPLTNREFTRTAAKIFKKTYLPIPVPKLILKLMLGEMASIVLGGCKVSSRRIEEAGYTFQFPKFEKALEDLKNKNLLARDLRYLKA